MHIDVLLGSDRPTASVSFSNPATDLQAAPVTPHSLSRMILHVMIHLPKFLVTRLLPVSPALEKLEHCGICPRPRSHLRQAYFARYYLYNFFEKLQGPNK